MARIPNMWKRGNRWHIAYRHPVLPGYMDNLVRRKMGTKDEVIAMKVGLAIEQLRRDSRFHDLGARTDALALFPKPAVDAFFEPMRMAAESSTTEAVVDLPPWATDDELQKVQKYEEFVEEALCWRRDGAKWKARALRYEALLDLHGISVGESSITCKQAYDAWRQRLHCRSEREKTAVLRRVGFVVEALGQLTLSELTRAQQIEAALKESLAKVRSRSRQRASSPYESYLRLRDVRRYLRFANKEYRLFHLREVIDGLHHPTPQTIAKRNRVDTLDMSAVERFVAGTGSGPFNTESEHLYWKGLVGTLVYAGLRLSELACLRWSDVELDELIHVRQTKDKELKGGLLHERPVRPLPECWPQLHALQPITGESNLVFPRMMGTDLTDSSWLVRDLDKMVARPLTMRLRKLETKIGLGRRIPSRARRTCQTLMLMRAPGQAKLIDLQLGHSEAVFHHYTDVEQVVRAFQWA